MASPGDATLKNPITGVAGCCARAANDHATAPPSSDTNWRRLITEPTELNDYSRETRAAEWGRWSVCTAAIRGRECRLRVIRDASNRRNVRSTGAWVIVYEGRIST